ncbi:MAG: geranylgeranyl reductase family protein [Firmicutes bacterium]|nr:geranylgeranyl reductase family protein [Bacillota bacterium]
MIYDLIVVGGGPAGSAAAQQAAGAGLHTLLLEKDPFPRHKPCGGGLSEPAIREFDSPLPDGIISGDCRGVRVIFGNLVQESRFPFRVATLTDRAAFDTFLLDLAVKAGTQVRYERVAEVKPEPEWVMIRTDRGTYRGRAVVGADGAGSIARSVVRRRQRRDILLFSLSAEIPIASVVRNSPAAELGAQEMVEIHIGRVARGYCWIFPKGDRLSAGIAGLGESRRTIQAKWESFCLENGLTPTSAPRAHIIPSYHPDDPLVADRIVLAGDAAGAADPFLGEGIYYARLSGKLAAERISSLLASGSSLKAEDLRPYQAACRKAYADELLYARSVFNLLFRLPVWLQRRVFTNADVLGRYMEIPAGRSTYRRYWRWLLPSMPVALIRSHKASTRKTLDG